MPGPSVRLTDEALADIQGLITSGYGHLPQAAYLFVTANDASSAREWLAGLARTVTSSTRRAPGGGRSEKPPTAVNVGFTARGLAACGLPARVLGTFPAEFQDGMASPERSRILGDTDDSAPDRWEFGGSDADRVHAVVFLYAADEPGLDALCDAQRALLTASGGGVVEMPGRLQRGYRPESGAEPFGFHDGVAQPAIAGLKDGGVPTGEFILGYENHYGLMPPTPAVPRALDPGGVLPRLENPYHAGEELGDLGRHGSFAVYRKLQQDVVGFWRFMDAEAARLGRADPATVVWLASKCVGRWPSGAPLVASPAADDPRLGDLDDFGYAGDPAGLACPIGAHVRRMNPRDDLKPYAPAQSRSMSEAHRLLRRGRAYGPPLVDRAVLERLSAGERVAAVLAGPGADGHARGIHFVCINANLKSQFEFVQQTWANNPHFGGLHDNTDPIAGARRSSGDGPSRMTIPRDDATLRTRPLPSFITVKGGAYLFIPSLTALRFLAAPARRVHPAHAAAARQERPKPV